MIDQIVNAVLARVQSMIGAQGQPRWGTVASVDPTRPAVKVRLQPEDVMTGWLPVVQQAAGGGWSVVTIPTIGQQAFIIPDNGDAQHGVAVGFAHNDGARLAEVPAVAGTGGTPNPTDVPQAPGETVLTGPGGQVIRLGPAGIYMRGTVTIDGNLRVNGDVSDKVGSLALLRGHYNTHRHTETGAVTQITDTPDP